MVFVISGDLIWLNYTPKAIALGVVFLLFNHVIARHEVPWQSPDGIYQFATLVIAIAY